MSAARLTACLLILAISASAAAPSTPDANLWKRLRYSGGTVKARVHAFDWNTSLEVKQDELKLVLGYRLTVQIKPSAVTALSYGREAHRRVADMVALSFVFTPVALFGLLHESKTHLIGIEYKDGEGKPAALLLEAHKDEYRAILQALKVATGKPVENAP